MIFINKIEKEFYYKKSKGVIAFNLIVWTTIIGLIIYIVLNISGVFEKERIKEYTLRDIAQSSWSNNTYLAQCFSESYAIIDEEYVSFESIGEKSVNSALDSENEILVSNTYKSPDKGKSDNNSVKETNSSNLTKNNNLLKELKTNYDFNFLKNNFYIVDATTSINSKILNPKKLLSKDLKIKKDKDKKQILIYHTHSTETFSDSREGNADDTIVGVGRVLADILENDYGYGVIHNTKSYDVVDGKWNRLSYDTALPDLKKILSENKDIEVIIDLHRDSGSKKEVTTVNGKKTARIMFFNGISRTKNASRTNLPNEHLEGNLAFSLQMQTASMSMYEDFVKKTYLKGYRYNLHLLDRSTLIEVGNDKNTVSEAKNAMAPLAKIINSVLNN